MMYWWIFLNCLYIFLVNGWENLFLILDELLYMIIFFILIVLINNLFCVYKIRRIYILINLLGWKD